MKSLTYVLAVVGLINCLPAQQETSMGQGSSIPALEQSASLDLTNATLADAINYLGKTYKVNGITDAYPNSADFQEQTIRIPEASLKRVIEQLAQMYSRDIQWRDNLILLYRRNGSITDSQPTQNLSNSKTRLVLERLDAPDPLNLPPAVSAGLPAARLALQASGAFLGDLAKEFSHKIGWELQIESGLRTRRINAWLQNVTPGQLLEAITALVNARQKVLIEQSEAQKTLEQDLKEAAGSQRLLWSSPFKRELLNLLDQDQRTRYEQGEIISFRVDDLPAHLRDFAYGYIQISYEHLRQNGDDALPELNMARLSEFTIDLLPPPSIAVGVTAYGVDGRRLLW